MFFLLPGLDRERERERERGESEENANFPADATIYESCVTGKGKVVSVRRKEKKKSLHNT